MSITCKEDLLNRQTEVKEQINTYTCRVLVCSGTGCIASGSEKIYEGCSSCGSDQDRMPGLM